MESENSLWYCPKCKIYPVFTEIGYTPLYEEHRLDGSFISQCICPKHTICGTDFIIKKNNITATPPFTTGIINGAKAWR